MIPKDRPVIGRDLETLRQKLGLTVEDMSYMIGIAMPGWSRIVKKGETEPVRDVTIALMVRYLDKFYDRNFMPKFSSPDELAMLAETNPQIREDLRGDMSLKKLGLLVGREASAGHRWKHSGRGISPAIARVCLLIMTLAKENGSIKDWIGIMEEESQARGVSNIWQHGKWRPATEKAAKKTKEQPAE